MTEQEAEDLIALCRALAPSARVRDDTARAWSMAMDDLPFVDAKAAVIRIFRGQEYHSLPTVAAIRAEVVGGARTEQDAQSRSPAYGGPAGCGRCHNGLVVLHETPRGFGDLYPFAYRCPCPAGHARPEKYPWVPAWAREDAPLDRKTASAGDARAAVAAAVRATAMPDRQPSRMREMIDALRDTPQPAQQRFGDWDDGPVPF